MATYIKGITMPNQKVTPSDDGALNATGNRDGIVSGVSISRSGANVYLGAGRILACGREVAIESSTQITLATSNTYARIKLVIDMSKSENQRVALDVDYADSLAAFTLTTDDLNSGGTKYELPVAICSYSGGTWADVYKLRGSGAKAVMSQYALSSGNWSSLTYEQIDVFASGSANALCVPDPSTRDEWKDCDVYLEKVEYGKLTFKCKVAPSSNVKANILWL